MKSLGASLHLGAAVRDDGVVFRAWAPRCRTLDVVIEGRRPLAMSRQDDGLFEAVVAGLRPGTRYQYRLDGARYRPDPASRFQPEGVHGPSMAVNPGSFPWTDQVFTGHALADLVIYELHVGTFTRVGTFEAIVPHLPHLVDLGVTAVELMPVAEFPGSRNWGYDGVHLFAAQSTYVGPRGERGGRGAGPAGARHGRVARQRPAHRVTGRRGRPRAGRRVVGRLPPRAARAPHRRARRLLRGLHRAATPADGTGRGLRLPGRVLGVLRPRSRHAERRPSRRAVRDLRADSRSGRQPRPGRPPQHDRAVRGGEAGVRPAAGGAGDPAALHGRGVRRDGAVPVLHVVPRSRPRRGGEEGARRGVQPLRVAGRGARSRRARDVRALASQSPAGRRAAPPRALPVLPALAGPASLASRAGRAGQGARAGDGGREGDDAHALPRGRVRRRAAAARQPHERGSEGTVGAGRLAPAARLRRSALRGPGPPGAGALPTAPLRDA